MLLCLSLYCNYVTNCIHWDRLFGDVASQVPHLNSFFLALPYPEFSNPLALQKATEVARLSDFRDFSISTVPSLEKESLLTNHFLSF